MQKPLKSFRPVILIFVVINALLLTGRSWQARLNMDQETVILGNLLLFLITLFSFFLCIRGLKNPNPHAFVRSVYTSMMAKLFLCAGAAFVYIAVAGKGMNKPALFATMALYLVYSFVEVSILMKLLREKTA